MEKEIELIRMSSTEIIEKVATYKDEQVIIHNQVNKIDAIEQNTIKADFLPSYFMPERKSIFISQQQLLRHRSE